MGANAQYRLTVAAMNKFKSLVNLIKKDYIQLIHYLKTKTESELVFVCVINLP